MDPLSQIRISSLMAVSNGSPNITIGLIDGPVDLSHPAFQGSKIKFVKESQFAKCRSASSLACRHGTFVAGILCSKRGLSAPAICPGCTLLLRPVFRDQTLHNNTKEHSNVFLLFPTTTPEELSDAIIEMVDAEAKIINLSLGLSTSALVTYPKLQEAYDYARKRGAIIVVASGNQGSIGSISLLDNEWIIPVVACNEYGLLDPMSNFGPSIGARGLMSPGINISSTASGGGYIQMSGTSFAAPFVTGALSLLWSVFPTVSGAQLVYAIRRGIADRRLKSIVPPLLNVETSYRTLRAVAKK